MSITPFEWLSECDLVIDAVYEGAPGSHLSGEALSALLPGIGNMGGFRVAGKGANRKFVALVTSGREPDWPDELDRNTGEFTYYGDNRRPGHELHDTPSGGNRLLQSTFSNLHCHPNRRIEVAPFLVFESVRTDVSSRSFRFLGLAAPGYPGLPATSDLVAIWKTKDGQRFQNYRATFSILDVPSVSRAWINDLSNGNPLSSNCPATWKDWVENGRYRLLTAEQTTDIRTIEQQTPQTNHQCAVLRTIWERFRDAPVEFEAFAARLFQMTDKRVVIDEVTRGTIDGGRDAIGRYKLGLQDDPVYADFALEAKCFRPAIDGHSANTVGVKEVARLISRLRHRQFGVLVTTSAISRQVYAEVREDRHPIIFISGADIAKILIENDYTDTDEILRLIG